MAVRYGQLFSLLLLLLLSGCNRLPFQFLKGKEYCSVVLSPGLDAIQPGAFPFALRFDPNKPDFLYFHFDDFRNSEGKTKWERAFRMRLGEDRYEIVPGSDAPDLRFAVEFPFMGEGSRDFDSALENARKLGATRLENGTCCYPYPNRSRTRVAGVEWTGKVPGFMSPAFPTKGN